MRKTDVEKIAYLAGVFDGEGCVAVTRRLNTKGISHAVFSVIAMCDPEPLYLGQTLFGGRIHYQERPPDRPIYQWVISTGQTKAFFLAILPHLRVKRAQAQLAVEFLRLLPGRGRHWGDETQDRRRELAEQIRGAPRRQRHAPKSTVPV